MLGPSGAAELTSGRLAIGSDVTAWLARCAASGRARLLAGGRSQVDDIPRKRLGQALIRSWAQTGGRLLFHLISRLPVRHLDRRSSVIVTINLTFGVWPTVFGDAEMTTALLDRPTRYRSIAPTGNESRRFENRARSHLPKTASRG